MFETTTFFIIVQELNGSSVIKTLRLNREGQDCLCKIFTEATENFLGEDIEIIDFNIGYKPESHEVQKIHPYEMDESIINALIDPISVNVFTPIKNECPNIKAVFTGITQPEILIAFQRFNKSQYLANRGVNLFHSEGTLKRMDEFGISINTQVDCVFSKNRLLFKSYYNARQVFNLSSYYRIASDDDVNAFLSNEKISITDMDDFFEKTDEWVRKKIALIQDSGILQTCPIDEIIKTAEDCDVDICVKNNDGIKSIVLPEEKKGIKRILKFLDEDIYKGPLSNIAYETNSKRRFEISNS